MLSILLILAGLTVESSSLQAPRGVDVMRRNILAAPAVGIASFARAADLSFTTSAAGIQYADAVVGTGEAPEVGSTVAIEYVMSTTGAARGAKLYSTKDPGNSPYRWKVGDGTTIRGLEQAVAGAEGIPPMKAGGVRRVIITTEDLGYDAKRCAEDRGPGPTPRGETYQRFKNVFCNLQRPVTPELVLDVKLIELTAADSTS